jgi:hypothetical protein
MKAFLLVFIMLFSTSAKAVLCTTTTADGKKAFMFAANKPTKTLSGTVANLKPCPVVTIDVRKEVITEYAIPNPQNQCERTAVHVCDPHFQGIKLFTSSNSNEQGVIEQNCIGFTIKSGSPPDSTGIYYAYPSMYSGMKTRPDGSSYCVFDE